jgi:hypothetical protein
MFDITPKYVRSEAQNKTRLRFHEARMKFILSQSIENARELYKASMQLQIIGGIPSYDLVTARFALADLFPCQLSDINADQPGEVHTTVVLRISANRLVSMLNHFEGALLRNADEEKVAAYWDSDARYVADTIRDIIANSRERQHRQRRRYG